MGFFNQTNGFRAVGGGGGVPVESHPDDFPDNPSDGDKAILLRPDESGRVFVYDGTNSVWKPYTVSTYPDAEARIIGGDPPTVHTSTRDTSFEKTSKGGYGWTDQFSKRVIQLEGNSLEVIENTSVAYFLDWQDSGSETNLYKTTDGGDNWELQNEILPDEINVGWEIFFKDEQVGYLLGSTQDPNLFKTTDGGSTWSNADTGGSYTLGSIDLISGDGSQIRSYTYDTSTLTDPQTVWTDDGGSTWNVGQASFGIPWPNILWTDYSTAFSWETYPDFDKNGELYRTTDKGDNWSLVFTFTDSNDNEERLFTMGVSSYGLWMITDKDLWLSDDGGDTWTKTGGNTWPVDSGLRPQMEWTGGGKGWIYYDTGTDTSNYIQYTTDGSNWNSYQMDDGHTARGTTFQFFDDSNGLFGILPASYGGQGILRVANTKTGGESASSWVDQPIEFINGTVSYDADIVSKDEGWFVGDSHIVHYKNGGSDVTYEAVGREDTASGTNDLVKGDKRVTSVSFINSSEGWALVRDNSTSDTNDVPYLIYTSDGGSTWEKIYTFSNYDEANIYRLMGVHEVEFIDSSEGWVSISRDETSDVGDTFHDILKTTDGGSSWSVLTDTPNPLTKIEFINSSEAIGRSDERNLRFSDDGGSSWTTKNPPIGVVNFSFLNHDYGWVCGINGDGIYKTEDGGDNWTSLGSPIYDIYSIHFKNFTEGWVGGIDQVAHTVDGGKTFEVISTDKQNFNDRANFGIHTIQGF